MANILKGEDFLLFSDLCPCKFNVFGFWTVGPLKTSNLTFLKTISGILQMDNYSWINQQ